MRSRPVCKELLKLKFCAFVCGMGRHLILYRVCLNRYWFIITHWPLSFQNLYIVIANQGYIARKKSIQSYFFFLFIWSQFALWDTFLDCLHVLKFIWSGASAIFSLGILMFLNHDKYAPGLVSQGNILFLKAVFSCSQKKTQIKSLFLRCNQCL